ncbi:hypothetical protein SAMN04488523_105321 [Sulfitobacter brevis]|uniref:Phage tail tape measure protein n=1 Tax=Sulfitobacter brevis TaxID=74348 RepID=A0A1I1YSJ2_9RHOB|nr:hypothetical protein [Sulfitobacter brevis]SFE20950.1 hypothetical protein SAMN04488523_105321 [Sulfitobacter brevis]
MATLALTALTAIKGAGLSTILSAAGAGIGAVGAIQSGNAQNAAAQYQAAQLEASGKAERASSQREAEEQQRQTRLMHSRARAVGAASGGGIDLELAGDIEAEGEYSALTALWEGAEAAKGRNAQAAASRLEGKAAKKAGYLKGASKVFSGAASLYESLAPSRTILSNGQSLLEKYG